MKKNIKQNKRDEILVVAMKLASSKGFNAFSHRELADLIGIKSSSIHYYFPTKEKLGLAMMEQYHNEVFEYLATLQHKSPKEQIEAFTGLFVETAKSEDDICLAGMLASDMMTFGDQLKGKIKAFFTNVEEWISQLARELGLSDEQSVIFGQTYMATLEGALISTRIFGDVERIKQAQNLLLSTLK
jgi:TetR/AcrR family transcriptional repressor of nem operon